MVGVTPKKAALHKCLRTKQDNIQTNLSQQALAKRILTVFYQDRLHYCCLDHLHHLLMQNGLEGLSIYYEVLPAGAGTHFSSYKRQPQKPSFSDHLTVASL